MLQDVVAEISSITDVPQKIEYPFFEKDLGFLKLLINNCYRKTMTEEDKIMKDMKVKVEFLSGKENTTLTKDTTS